MVPPPLLMIPVEAWAKRAHVPQQTGVYWKPNFWDGPLPPEFKLGRDPVSLEELWLWRCPQEPLCGSLQNNNSLLIQYGNGCLIRTRQTHPSLPLENYERRVHLFLTEKSRDDEHPQLDSMTFEILAPKNAKDNGAVQATIEFLLGLPCGLTWLYFDCHPSHNNNIDDDLLLPILRASRNYVLEAEAMEAPARRAILNYLQQNHDDDDYNLRNDLVGGFRLPADTETLRDFVRPLLSRSVVRNLDLRGECYDRDALTVPDVQRLAAAPFRCLGLRAGCLSEATTVALQQGLADRNHDTSHNLHLALTLVRHQDNDVEDRSDATVQWREALVVQWLTFLSSSCGFLAGLELDCGMQHCISLECVSLLSKVLETHTELRLLSLHIQNIPYHSWPIVFSLLPDHVQVLELSFVDDANYLIDGMDYRQFCTDLSVFLQMRRDVEIRFKGLSYSTLPQTSNWATVRDGLSMNRLYRPLQSSIDYLERPELVGCSIRQNAAHPIRLAMILHHARDLLIQSIGNCH